MTKHNKIANWPILFVTALAFIGIESRELAADPPRLRVDESGRFLATEDGAPFFWMGDTAWSLVCQSVRVATKDQPAVELYFRKRSEQGFNVIQTSLLTIPVRGSIDAANIHEHLPFIDGNFARPRVLAGNADDYWDHVDYLVDLSAQYGMYMAVVVAWSNSLETDQHPLVADPTVAYAYGHFLGDRFRDRTHVVWLLGGDAFGRPDRSTLLPSRRQMTHALAEGIADGTNGVDRHDGTADWTSTLMTYHPPGGGASSSEFLHDEPWLDFNMIQSTTRFQFRNYETVTMDYRKEPTKPTFDAEVAYEYSLSLNRRELEERPDGRITAGEVRRAAYWSVFAGGCGHTYGHRNFIGWVCKGDAPLKHGADRTWFESLDSNGAQQMKHLRTLVESRPMHLRIPDQSLITSDEGAGGDHVRATRSIDGSYAFVYLPTGKPVTLNLDRLSGSSLIAYWYNPRTGESQRIGVIPRKGAFKFQPNENGENQDWVLVLDDASRSFPPLGEEHGATPVTSQPTVETIGLEFIDTSFENASPLHYEVDERGQINVFLVYDHERSSPNRAAGHWHFRVQARKGSQQTIIFNNLLNTWNGKQASIAKPGKRFTCHVSTDGKHWKATEMEVLPTFQLKLAVTMETDSLYVARTEPYRLSDLDRLFTSIKDNPLVDITPIGKTVEGRPLEIIRIGNEDAPHRLFLRARAHAFEAGGNWVVQGLIQRLLEDDDDARRYLKCYCVYVLPMANKDSVARGRTRFNSKGWDLNRKWDRPADPQLAPENHFLELWFGRMIAAGRRPHLAIDFHNDAGGKIHVSRPEPANPDYLSNMETYEALLRKHTWFTEGSTGKSFRNPGTISEGLLSRFDIHACVHELNVNWVSGLDDYPSGRNWELLGSQLCEVYFEYFADGATELDSIEPTPPTADGQAP